MHACVCLCIYARVCVRTYVSVHSMYFIHLQMCMECHETSECPWPLLPCHSRLPIAFEYCNKSYCGVLMNGINSDTICYTFYCVLISIVLNLLSFYFISFNKCTCVNILNVYFII